MKVVIICLMANRFVGSACCCNIHQLVMLGHCSSGLLRNGGLCMSQMGCISFDLMTASRNNLFVFPLIQLWTYLIFGILIQGVSSIAEDSVSPSVPELATTPIHQLSLGRMYPMFYETSQLQGYGLPGRPFSVTQMSPPMALPLMSVGNAGPGTPDQVTEVAGLGCNRESLSRNGSRKSIPIPVPAPSGPSLSLGGSLGASQVPYSFNSWPGVTHTGFNMPVSLSPQTSNVVRPTAKVAIAAPSVVKTEGEEDMKDIAQLSLGLSPPEPSQLTLKLLDQPSRHSSAFHVSTSFDTNSLQQGVNAISVV